MPGFADTSLAARETPIPGLIALDLPVHGDPRGWFKENWQREKMMALGLPDFGPVQNNISFNSVAGVTRGIHAEPWDKFVSVAAGRVFGAWVDLREGATFGVSFHCEIDPSVAVFVPRGVGNAFQSLEDHTAYTYLVNDHWSAEAQGEYTFLNLADPTTAVPWPIPLERAEISDKDRAHPLLEDVTPMPPRRALVLGANGQVGLALRELWADRDDVEFTGRDEIDLALPETLEQVPWSRFDTLINVAAHTAVDHAESDEGRRTAWAVNAAAPARLATLATAHRLTLVHISTDYVFDGTLTNHPEHEPFAPLSVYGQSKAAGDLAVSLAPHHYILRTSWVVGDGKNFITTMASLAARGMNPSVVGDQVGRLTFAPEIARTIDHLLRIQAPYGTYNVSNGGTPTTWAQIAQRVFTRLGHDPGRITPVTTRDYYAGKQGIAPRPHHSTLDLNKLHATGYQPRDQLEALSDYLDTLPQRPT